MTNFKSKKKLPFLFLDLTLEIVDWQKKCLITWMKKLQKRIAL